METRANYLLVGTFVLALTVGLVVFVVWLAKFEFDTVYARYDIRFTGSVTGLQTGSPVRYSGVRVGEVIDIRLDPDRPEEVLVTIEVDAQTPIRSDTVATLEIEGLTGGLYVLLSGTTLAAAPLEAKPGERRPVIKAEASTLQQVIEGAPELVQKIDLLLARSNDLLSGENRAHISATLANLDVFTTTLVENIDEMTALMRDASGAMTNLRGATAALEDLANQLKGDSRVLLARVNATLDAIETMAQQVDSSVVGLSGDTRGLIGDLRGTAKSLSAMSQELQAMIAENREPVRDFTATGLAEFSSLLIEMRELVIALNRVTTELNRDPARFFFGNQQEGYEAR